MTVSDDFIIPSIELFALVAPGKIEFKLEFGFLSTIEDSMSKQHSVQYVIADLKPIQG